MFEYVLFKYDSAAGQVTTHYSLASNSAGLNPLITDAWNVSENYKFAVIIFLIFILGVFPKQNKISLTFFLFLKLFFTAQYLLELFQNLIIQPFINILSEMDEKVESITQLLAYAKEFKGHIFYIGPLFRLAMIPINEYIPRFQILSCVDPFNGALSYYRVPKGLKDHKCTDFFACQAAILKNAETVAYMKQKDPRPNVVIGEVTSQLEEYLKDNGLNYWGVSSELFSFLGNKVKLIEVLKNAKIPFIPNVCSKINSYDKLVEIGAQLGGGSIVVQRQVGYEGRGTIFIQSQKDYIANKDLLQNGQEYKIMPFRRVKSLVINGIATNVGTVLGPIASELIGHPQLTPRRAGYCGNQLRSSYFEDAQVEAKIRKKIFELTERLGNFIYKKYNYRGVFGLDFVIDEDTNEVFLMEINPRITGSCALSFQVYRSQGYKFPLFLFHCLEFMGARMQLNIQALNKEWLTTEHYQNEFSYIAFKGTLDFGFRENIVPGGLWSLQQGDLVFTGSHQCRLSKMKQDEITFIPDLMTSSGIFIMKGRCQDYRFKLTKAAEELIGRFSKIGPKYSNEINS